MPARPDDYIRDISQWSVRAPDNSLPQFKVGDRIKITKSASYRITQPGSEGVVIKVKGNGFYRVKFDKLPVGLRAESIRYYDTFDIYAKYMILLHSGPPIDPQEEVRQLIRHLHERQRFYQENKAILKHWP